MVLILFCSNAAPCCLLCFLQSPSAVGTWAFVLKSHGEAENQRGRSGRTSRSKTTSLEKYLNLRQLNRQRGCLAGAIRPRLCLSALLTVSN